MTKPITDELILKNLKYWVSRWFDGGHTVDSAFEEMISYGRTHFIDWQPNAGAITDDAIILAINTPNKMFDAPGSKEFRLIRKFLDWIADE